MRRPIRFWVVVLLSVLLAATVIAVVLVPRLSRKSSIDIGELAAVEIREYEGAELSSIADFHENSIKGAQHLDLQSYRLQVDGLVQSPAEYTIEEITSRLPRYQKVATLNCVEGWKVSILWEGVLVKDLIAAAGPLPEAGTVIFHAADGYTTSLALDYLTGGDILLADKMNGLPLPPERGAPYQLVAESKWGYKWIKWVARIELSDDEDYEGYWESRGFSSEGTLP